ncbi:MAG: hypothetical protein Q8P95_02395 [bacterium]|nr:hypothetical protein [bacterium]
MWETSADVLNMILAIGVGAVCFVLIFVLFYLVLVLRDLSYASRHVRDTTQAINDYVRTPMKIALEAYKGVRDVMGWVEERVPFDRAQGKEKKKEEGKKK